VIGIKSQSLYIQDAYVYTRTVIPGFIQQIICDTYMLPMDRHLNGRMPDRRQVSASCVFCVEFRFGLCWEHLHVPDFEWLLPAACIVL